MLNLIRVFTSSLERRGIAELLVRIFQLLIETNSIPLLAKCLTAPAQPQVYLSLAPLGAVPVLHVCIGTVCSNDRFYSVESFTCSIRSDPTGGCAGYFSHLLWAVDCRNSCYVVTASPQNIFQEAHSSGGSVTSFPELASNSSWRASWASYWGHWGTIFIQFWEQSIRSKTPYLFVLWMKDFILESGALPLLINMIQLDSKPALLKKISRTLSFLCGVTHTHLPHWHLVRSSWNLPQASLTSTIRFNLLLSLWQRFSIAMTQMLFPPPVIHWA